MKNQTNYHTHTHFCDGKAPMEAFVQQAIAWQFSALGFSSHAPLPFLTRWTIDTPDDVERYLAEFQRLDQLYGTSIELYVGLEIDYLDETYHPASEYFRSLPLDYRIGSIHLLPGAEGQPVDIDTRPEVFRENLQREWHGDLRSVLECYFDRQMRMVEVGGFDLIGHPDKLSYNAWCCDPAVLTQTWYRKKIAEFFSFLSERDLLVEVNTKLLHRNGLFYPNREHFKLLRELNLRLVVNSDAHHPDLLDAGRGEAIKALQENGIRNLWELHEGGWQLRAIE